jgi:hypothetical protein
MGVLSSTSWFIINLFIIYFCGRKCGRSRVVCMHNYSTHLASDLILHLIITLICLSDYMCVNCKAVGCALHKELQLPT